MAAEGVRLTSFYAPSPVCTASRASLLTGCYARRVGMHKDVQNRLVLYPGSPTGLNPEEVTIAEALKPAGYATAIIGKWHLGDQPEFLPTRQGFDYYFGLPYPNNMGVKNPRHKFPPLPVLRGETVIETEPDQAYLTKRYTEEAIAFIEKNRNRPFFLFLAHTMPHDPLAVSPRFAGKSNNGLYGDVIEELDWSVGEILKTVARLKIDDQTLILFTSDNGGDERRPGTNGPLRGGKMSTFEGGLRVPCIIRWPGKLRGGQVCDELTTGLDLMPTFLRLAGVPLPSDRIIDGVDIWPVLSSCAPSPRKVFYYYALGDLQAVRAGKWKLHVSPKASPELYDLVQDVGETTDVASQSPGVVRRLQELLEQAKEDIGDGARQGKNQRAPGLVEQPRFLTSPE